MFSTEMREALREQLITRARQSPEILAAALLGSAAQDAEDAWSDIDLALRLAPEAEPIAVAEHWTAWLRAEHPVVDHLDLWSHGGLYRVLLLDSTLQIDLSFWPGSTFRAHGPAFSMIFGEPPPADVAEPVGSADSGDQIGWAWLYALHARSAIARGRSWQAVWMLEQLRNQIISLACARHGVPVHEGRGVDVLPADLTGRLSGTLIGSTDRVELGRVFAELTTMLITEIEKARIEAADFDCAGLVPVLRELAQVDSLLPASDKTPDKISSHS